MYLTIISWKNICFYVPFQLFLGRWVVDGQRELINKFSLKNRTYIGSTSMDAQLSFIMANCAQVQPGDTVVDPFVGTGKSSSQTFLFFHMYIYRHMFTYAHNTLSPPLSSYPPRNSLYTKAPPLALLHYM